MHLSWCLAACSKTGNSLPTPEERVKEILSGKVTEEAMEMGWLDHEMMAWLEKNATFAGGDGDGTVNQVEDVTDLFKQTKITISDPAKIPSKEIDSYFSIMEMPDKNGEKYPVLWAYPLAVPSFLSKGLRMPIRDLLLT